MATGRYQLAINGFNCINETWDDALNRDGNHDEVFFDVSTKVVRGSTGTVVATTDTTSAVLGDINGFSGRIQAGSGATWWGAQTGGVMSGDSYPGPQPWLQTKDPSGRNYPPYAIWQGDLDDSSDEVVFVTPTIWELDIGQDALQGWANWQVGVDAKFGPRAKEIFGGIWPVAKPFFDAISLGIQTFATLPGMWSPLGNPRSRPIGLQRDPANPDGTTFNPIIITLTYNTAEYLVNNNLTGRGQGILGYRYTDDPFLRGDYQIWLQLKKVGGATVWPDGSVLREVSSPKIYVVYGGAKFWITDPPTLFRLFPAGWAQVQIVPDGTLNALGAVPTDGTILREEHSAYVWRIEHGSKRHITTPSVLTRYGGWPVVHVVPDFSLSAIPAGQDIT